MQGSLYIYDLYKMRKKKKLPGEVVISVADAEIIKQNRDQNEIESKQKSHLLIGHLENCFIFYKLYLR